MPLMQNRPGSHAVSLDVANNTYQLTDFATPNTSTETVSAVNITKIMWTGPWKIVRGTNTVFTTDTGAGHWDLRSMGIVITGNNSSNVVISSTAANSTLILEFNKISAISQGYV